MLETIYTKAQKVVDNFQKDVSVSEHVEFNMNDTLNRSDAYYNSQFISSKTDSLGREKPFFNVVKAKVNIAKRATDIDTKHIKLKTRNSDDYLKTFLANLKLREWMKKSDYASYLNKWGKDLGKYGSVVTKYVGTEVKPEVVPWNRLAVDPTAFEAAPVVEKIFLTPQELKARKGYDQEMVDLLLANLSSKKNMDDSDQKGNDNFVEIWEVHGELPLTYLTDDEDGNDDNTFVQQMHVISRMEADNGEIDDYTLYRGKEAKSPYTIAHWDEEDGRTLGIGVVEDLFETQEQINFSKKAQKDQLDMASKMIFQTTDGNFGQANVLTQIETGDVIVTESNKPISQLNNQADVVSLQNYGIEWDQNGDKVTSTPDAISGQTMPSNTPLGSVQIQNREAHSLFEWVTENKGLYIERDLRKFIIPYIMTQLDTTEEIVATLSADEIVWFDNLVVETKISERVREDIIAGRVVQPKEAIDQELKIREQLNSTGNTRFVSPGKNISWKKYFEDFEWDVDIEITGENLDKQSALTTLFTVFQTISSNPAVLQDKTSRSIFNKILETAGAMSPTELPPIQPEQQMQQQAQGSPPRVKQETVEDITSGQLKTT